MLGKRSKVDNPQGEAQLQEETTPLLVSSFVGETLSKRVYHWWLTQPAAPGILALCALIIFSAFTYAVEPCRWKAPWYLVTNTFFPPTHPECSVPASTRWCRSQPGVDIACLQDDIVCDSICNWGYWEFASIAAMGFPQTPQGNVVDVGANVGWYTFLFAQAGHTVHAFEALSSNVALLRGSLCANPSLPGRVEIHEVALSEIAGGKCEVFSSVRNVGDGSLCCDMNNCEMYWNKLYRHRQSVQVSTLDSELLKSRILDKPLAFLKVDVEGLECEVLRGARQTLAQLAPQYLMSEIWDEEAKCPPGDFLRMLHDNKYKMVIGRSLGFPAAVTDTADRHILQDHGPHNLFAQRFPWPVSKQSLLQERSTERKMHPETEIIARVPRESNEDQLTSIPGRALGTLLRQSADSVGPLGH